MAKTSKGAKGKVKKKGAQKKGGKNRKKGGSNLPNQVSGKKKPKKDKSKIKAKGCEVCPNSMQNQSNQTLKIIAQRPGSPLKGQALNILQKRGVQLPL